jgi:hypothetical protein
MCRNSQHWSLFDYCFSQFRKSVSTSSHQRNVCHQLWTALCGKHSLPQTGSISLWMSFALSPFAHKKKKHNRTLFFSIALLEHGHHFGYWKQPMNMSMRLCYLACHDAGLCCYLVVHIESLLRPLPLFYFHLWCIYWLFVVTSYKFNINPSSMSSHQHATVFICWHWNLYTHVCNIWTWSKGVFLTWFRMGFPYLSVCFYNPLLGLVRFFSFLVFYTVSSTPWTGDQPITRPLPAHRTTQTK